MTAVACLATTVACGGGDAPELSGLTDQVAQVGTELKIDLNATDPDGDQLSYSFHAAGSRDHQRSRDGLGVAERRRRVPLDSARGRPRRARVRLHGLGRQPRHHGDDQHRRQERDRRRDGADLPPAARHRHDDRPVDEEVRRPRRRHRGSGHAPWSRSRQEEPTIDGATLDQQDGQTRDVALVPDARAGGRVRATRSCCRPTTATTPRRSRTT